MSDRPANATAEANDPLEIHAISRPRRRWKRWVVLLVVLLVAAIALSRPKSADTAAPIQYRTDTARRGNLVVTVSATGNLATDRDALREALAKVSIEGATGPFKFRPAAPKDGKPGGYDADQKPFMYIIKDGLFVLYKGK